MSLLVEKAREQVTACIKNAADAAIKKGALEKADMGDFSVSVRPHGEHGVDPANAAMGW